MDNGFVRDLAGRLARNVPQGIQGAGADLERNFESVLQGAFKRLDLVTREEFDVQRKLLQRSREKLDALQAELDQFKAGVATGKESATD